MNSCEYAAGSLGSSPPPELRVELHFPPFRFSRGGRGLKEWEGLRESVTPAWNEGVIEGE